jgi:hypothetical protein
MFNNDKNQKAANMFLEKNLQHSIRNSCNS